MKKGGTSRSEKDERTRQRNRVNQRNRRAKLTEDELDQRRAKDRMRYEKKKECRRINEVESVQSTATSFSSERLQVSFLNKKLEEEMKFFNIHNQELLFEKKLDNLHIISCPSCDTFYWSNRSVCYCNKFKNMVSQLMKIGPIPEELRNLTYVEELLISKVHPMISIYRLKGGQYGFKGHVINFRQDVASFCKQLPHSVAVLKGLISVCCNTPSFHKDFLIRRNKVSIALHWLKEHNKHYHEIEIDMQTILSLPDNGYYSETVTVPDDCATQPDAEDQEHEDEIERVVVPGITSVSTSEQIKHHIKWPQISSEPVNEFNTRGYIVQAFPCLFPYGIGDYQDVKDKTVTARVYFQYLMQKVDRRFSKHKLFPYFALNSILRWEALSLGTLYIKKKPQLKSINVEHLKDLVNQSMHLPKSVMIYSSSIRGSKSYWMSRTYELDAMVDRFSLPTLFFSLSAADYHWPRQFEIILSQCSSHVTVSELSEKMRRELLIENADICADYFYETVSIFITEVLVPFLKVLEYWFRFEWQMRGVAHVHGVLWLASAPSVLGFDKMSDPEKQNIIDYFSALVHAWNPNCQYTVTSDHPCRLKVSQVEDQQEDLAALVNTVQKHKCSKHCLRPVKDRNGKTSAVKCRHHFPHKLQNISTVERNDRGHLEFFPRRNDPFLNKYHELIMAMYRANHDATPIMSYSGFVRYISKYASKGEIKSNDLLQILKMIVFESDAENSVKSVIQKLFMNLAADRDYSFQEVIHLLKGHKLFQCSRTFVVLNLSNSEWQAHSSLSSVLNASGSTGKEMDVLSSYAVRPQKYERLSLYESMKWFNIKTYKRYTKERVVRIMPRLKQEHNSKMNEEVWRQNAILNIPWRDLDNLIVNDSWEVTCSINRIGLDKFPYQVLISEEYISDDESEGEDELEISQEDWMKICSMTGNTNNDDEPVLGMRLIDLSYPWSDNVADEFFANLLLNFISDAKKDTVITKDFSNLPKCNPDQENVLKVLQRQIDYVKKNAEILNKIPRICVCEGFAGSGKSILLQSMVQIVEDQLGDGSTWIMAPTGSSALHVNGQTVHSALRLNWRDLSNMPDLRGETLFKWREKHHKVKFIFIEEYSMVGCRLMYVLHKRLCQLTEQSMSYGNLFVWMVGNIRQLPPVGDTPWYIEDLSGAPAVVVSGSLLHKEIDLVCCLRSQLRQTNLRYLQCLDNVSRGIVTENDKVILFSRFMAIESVETSEEFRNAVHIFSKRRDVALYNIRKLVELKSPVLCIEAENSSRYAKASSSDQALGLPQKLYLSIGCRVILKRNLWTDAGLVNGALGSVIDIVYQSSSDPSPFAIIIKFDQYYGPVLNNGGVPITKITNSWYSKNILCSRHQFPLELAYSVTIYKSEGLTLSKVVLHVVTKEMVAGEYYVALSRVKCPQDIAIVYDGIIDDCPLFNLNQSIYQQRIAAESKLLQKASRAV